MVRLATHRSTYQQYACKIMTLPAVGAIVADTENSREDIFREIEILCGLEHKNIVELQVLLYFHIHPSTMFVGDMPAVFNFPLSNAPRLENRYSSTCHSLLPHHS